MRKSERLDQWGTPKTGTWVSNLHSNHYFFRSLRSGLCRCFATAHGWLVWLLRFRSSVPMNAKLGNNNTLNSNCRKYYSPLPAARDWSYVKHIRDLFFVSACVKKRRQLGKWHIIDEREREVCKYVRSNWPWKQIKGAGLQVIDCCSSNGFLIDPRVGKYLSCGRSSVSRWLLLLLLLWILVNTFF